MSTLLTVLCLCLLAVLYCQASHDVIKYDINTQARCRYVFRKKTNNCIWPSGLNAFADQIAEGGRIVAYRIRWFNGRWSGWYVPGVNDLDRKFNRNANTCAALPSPKNTMRRMWSYFYDHTHSFIICKPT